MREETRKVPGRWESMMGDRHFVDDPDGTNSIIEVKCCGVWLRCDRFTNTCETCEADFNMSGNRLASREQWGEETGESYADIVGGDL